MPTDKKYRVVDPQGVEREGVAVDIMQVRSAPVLVDLADGTQLILNIGINQCFRVDEDKGPGGEPAYTCNVGFNLATILPDTTEAK